MLPKEPRQVEPFEAIFMLVVFRYITWQCQYLLVILCFGCLVELLMTL
jgi:hypothetical protein